jgi:LPS sulfotransferase NodH
VTRLVIKGGQVTCGDCGEVYEAGHLCRQPRPSPLAASAAYAICTTPRTASQFLGEQLTRRGLGQPDEYLARSKVLSLVREWGIGHREYLPELWRRRTINGVFGARLHWHHLDESYQAVYWRDALPPDARVTWILLTRDDIAAQARSFYTAAATGDWGSGRPYLDDIDEREVAFLARRFRVHNERWRAWLYSSGAPYLHLTSELVVADPDAAADAIARRVLERVAA